MRFLLSRFLTPLLGTAFALSATCSALAGPKPVIPVFDSDATKAFAKKVVADVEAGRLKRVDANQLGKAYASNEVAADTAYKDKYLLVLGTVQGVSKDMFDNIIVKLKSNNQFLAVHARLDKSVAVIEGMENDQSKAVTMKTVSTVEAAGALKPGQRVQLICQGDGAVIGSPQLKLCDTLSK